MGRTPGLAVAHAVLRIWRRLLERKLRHRLGAKVQVEIHDNTHTMVTFQRRRALWRLRLHHMFLKAPDEVLSALVAYVRRLDSEASSALDRYIEQNRSLIRRPSPKVIQRRLRLNAKGRVHDLEGIFRSLNRRYFDGQVRASITFGSAPRLRGPRKSIKMGSYSADSRVIRIHPALDRPDVPRYFVEWIVFHEMLHHVHRARRLKDGRRCVHTPEFLEHERKFRDYRKAQAWEERNLDLLLRA